MAAAPAGISPEPPRRPSCATQCPASWGAAALAAAAVLLLGVAMLPALGRQPRVTQISLLGGFGPARYMAKPRVGGLSAAGGSGMHSGQRFQDRTDALAARRAPRTSSPPTTGPAQTSPPPRQRRLEGVERCETFACLRAAHAAASRGNGTSGGPGGVAPPFNFPHFLVIGWQKCATTSLWAFLAAHPQVLPPKIKEPQLYRDHCAAGPSGVTCNATQVRRYIDVLRGAPDAGPLDGSKAALEASPATIRGGVQLATYLRRELPWVKLIISMREPLSRLISSNLMTAGALARQREMERSVSPTSSITANEQECLEQLYQDPRSLYRCMRLTLDNRRPAFLFYSHTLEPWLQLFPRQQLHVLQYELLTSPSTHARVLRGLLQFLGLDPQRVDPRLPLKNGRRQKLNPQGWPMQRWQYEELVEAVRPDAERVVSLVEQYGYGSRIAWLSAWEGVWRRNLESCTPEGECRIELS